jgi:hypothetical protein
LAAQGREAALETCRDNRDPEVARECFYGLAVEAGAPRDSLWAVGVYELAQLSLDAGDEAGAAAWSRWAYRGTGVRPDEYFRPSVRLFVEDAVVDVEVEDRGGALPDGLQGIAWGALPGGVSETEGRIRVSTADPAVRLTVTSRTQEGVPQAPDGPLPPGTYTVVAEADGYESAEVVGEVLPGVETQLEFSLRPELPTGFDPGRVGITLLHSDGSTPICANGVVTGGEDRLLVTPIAALRGQDSWQVQTTGGAQDLKASKSRTGQEMAVFRPEDGASLPAPGLAPDPRPNSGWVIYRSGCDDEPAAVRVDLGGSTVATDIDLSPSVPAAALGAPGVDERGRVVGIVMGPERAVPAFRMSEAVQVAEFGGGFPVLGVSIGVVAAGGLAALLLGGGNGDGDGNGNGNGSQTGTIRILVPGGQ